MSTPEPPRKVAIVPIYWVAWAMITVAAMVIVSAVISIALADQNARELVDRYESDKRAASQANHQLYCTLFASQADAFEDATSAPGKASRKAWLDLYALAKCQPAR
jgi:hypothetical protein